MTTQFNPIAGMFVRFKIDPTRRGFIASLDYEWEDFDPLTRAPGSPRGVWKPTGQVYVRMEDLTLVKAWPIELEEEQHDRRE